MTWLRSELTILIFLFFIFFNFSVSMLSTPRAYMYM